MQSYLHYISSMISALTTIGFWYPFVTIVIEKNNEQTGLRPHRYTSLIVVRTILPFSVKTAD